MSEIGANVFSALLEHGICRSCELLGRLTGRPPEPKPMSRFDALVELGAAHPADTLEFEADLRRWIGEAA